MNSGTEVIDRKQRIRDRYRGVDTSELEVIPAKIVEGLGESTSIRRVAAYVRVSTDNDEQTSSYELQKNYYTDYIKAQPGWEFVGIYDDEGISGTSLAHRKGMQQLIEDCKAGKIDLILTKSIARFARNIVDCLSVIETLKNLDPPVGVKFEADNIYTLDSNGRMILTILASVAEEESHSKSIIMNWSIDRRFSRGLFLTPALLGYDQDEDGNLVVNEDEAQTVKVIYYLYLNGFSLKDIAELLITNGRRSWGTRNGIRVRLPASLQMNAIVGMCWRERLSHQTSLRTRQRRTTMIERSTVRGITTRQSFPEMFSMRPIICAHPGRIKRKIIRCLF